MKNIFEVISETDWKTFYLVTKHKDNSWSCTCPNNRFNLNICKHIQKVLKEYYKYKRQTNYK